MMPILNEILLKSSLTFLWVGSCAGVLVGAGMLLRPAQVVRMNDYLSRWVSTDKVHEAIDRPRWVERHFYRYHRAVGVAVTLGALLVLYTFLFAFDRREIYALIPRGHWWLSNAALNALLVGSALAAVIGVIVIIRPSILKDIEKALNRWVSTERLETLLNSRSYSAEKPILRHSQLAGTFILLGSAYVLVALGQFLFSGPATKSGFAMFYALW